MNDYLYPIKIKKWPQVICFEEYHVFPIDQFKLSDLSFVGEDSFAIDPIEGSAGCKVTVERKRLETDSEMATRVAKEEAYMGEYNKRNKKKV